MEGQKRQSGKPMLTAEQRVIADRLAGRAQELRAAAERDGDHLTIQEAIDVAAIQLGLADRT